MPNNRMVDPTEVEDALWIENERLRAILRRVRQALRSLDEISDEELGGVLTALDAAVE